MQNLEKIKTYRVEEEEQAPFWIMQLTTGFIEICLVLLRFRKIGCKFGGNLQRERERTGLDTLTPSLSFFN